VSPVTISCHKIVELLLISLQKSAIMLLYTVSGDVAQLVERDNRTVEARGSNPLISTSHRGSVSRLFAGKDLQIASRYGIVSAIEK
jgi:hypothetical protein